MLLHLCSNLFIAKKSAPWLSSQYIYVKSKLLETVIFAKLVYTVFFTVMAEQHAPYTQFLPKLARNESNVPKLKSS